MITFDFDYFRPDSVEEAVQVYQELAVQGKTVLYYAGGTEIISAARRNRLRFDAVIDLKGIPECKVLESRDGRILIGADVTLTAISDSGSFPLLSEVCRRSADHTSRDKITLGGNLCGNIPYKEAILPLLLAECQVTIAGPDGKRTEPLSNLYHQKLELGNGEFLVQVSIDQRYAALPYLQLRRTRQERTGYPLVSAASIASDGQIRIAFSGVCDHPFRLTEIEEELNQRSRSAEERIDGAMRHLPGPLLSDLLGSAAYREFVTRNAISDTMAKLGGIH